MWKFLKFVLITGMILGVLGVLAAGGGVLYALHYYSRGLPDFRQLADYEPPTTTRLHAGDGRLLAEYAVEKRVFVPIEAIPRRVINAFIAAEDKNFYVHPGVDFLGVVRATITNVRNMGKGRRPEGASTITQQVAKNFLLSNEVSYERKIREMILAFRIERTFSKDRILELYLNEIYLGIGSYGVAAAALNYFNKSLDELSIAEAAYLAALPKAPNNYHPTRYPEAAQTRRDYVLDRMRADGYITSTETREAKLEPIEMFKRVDFGHEIARRCRTLADVREVVGKLRTASSWGFMVSSAAEQSALLVETSGEAVRFVDPQPGHDHLAQTNRYRHGDLAAGEVTSSLSFALDSDARFDRANGATERLGKLDRDDLQRLLGDTGDPGAPDPEAEDRLGGNCIVSAMTVQSVVFEPEARRLRMSVGAAPTGLGPWVDIDHAWDGPVECVEYDEASYDAATAAEHSQREAMRHYVAATRAHLDGHPAREVLRRLEQAVDATPSEPNYRFLAAMFAISLGKLERARHHLAAALEREQGAYRRALCLLWHARVLAADGRLAEARAAWRELARLPETEATGPLQQTAERESARPLGRVRLRMVVPDIFLVDAVLPGV